MLIKKNFTVSESRTGRFTVKVYLSGYVTGLWDWPNLVFYLSGQALEKSDLYYRSPRTHVLSCVPFSKQRKEEKKLSQFPTFSELCQSPLLAVPDEGNRVP